MISLPTWFWYMHIWREICRFRKYWLQNRCQKRWRNRRRNSVMLCNIRGQGYVNGSNISGKYIAPQAIISEKNNEDHLLPCAAHIINLVRVYAAIISVNTASYIWNNGMTVYIFLTCMWRWNILMNCSEVPLKVKSSTWSWWWFEARAVRQLRNAFKALNSITNDASNIDNLSQASHKP
jgi:hypothetical protein